MSQFPVVRQVPQGAYRVTNSGQYRIDNPCRLIINYVPQSLTPEVFNEMFVPYGTIVYSKLIMDKKSYGFVEYSKPEEAALAIQQLNGVVVLNKRLKVSYSRNPSPDLKNSNVYIAGYGTDLREEDLRMIFSNYGTIINMNMLKDKNGLSRGAAFIRLNSNQEAINAVNALNGTKLNGRIIYAKIHNSSTVRNGKEFIMGVDDGNDIYASFMNGTTNSTPIGENGLHRSLMTILIIYYFVLYSFVLYYIIITNNKVTYSASDLQDIPDANIHNYGAISLPQLQPSVPLPVHTQMRYNNPQQGSNERQIMIGAQGSLSHLNYEPQMKQINQLHQTQSYSQSQIMHPLINQQPLHNQQFISDIHQSMISQPQSQHLQINSFHDQHLLHLQQQQQLQQNSFSQIQQQQQQLYQAAHQNQSKIEQNLQHNPIMIDYSHINDVQTAPKPNYLPSSVDINGRTVSQIPANQAQSLNPFLPMQSLLQTSNSSIANKSYQQILSPKSFQSVTNTSQFASSYPYFSPDNPNQSMISPILAQSPKIPLTNSQQLPIQQIVSPPIFPTSYSQFTSPELPFSFPLPPSNHFSSPIPQQSFHSSDNYDISKVHGLQMQSKQDTELNLLPNQINLQQPHFQQQIQQQQGSQQQRNQQQQNIQHFHNQDQLTAEQVQQLLQGMNIGRSSATGDQKGNEGSL